MSKNSKSVSFEEYRNRDKTWHHECREINSDGHARHAYSDIPSSRFPKILGHSHDSTNNNFNEITQLPPPLEPRERLVPYIDPVTADLSVIPNWCNPLMMSKRESINDKMLSSYIMPSSLIPATQEASNRIPPPTAFRDEISKFKNLYHQCSRASNKKGDSHNEHRADDIGNGDSIYDIIEIKRPGTVSLRQDESESGLANQYQPVTQTGRRDSSSQFTKDISQNHYGSNEQTRFRCGLFNLPEIYCPPPLAPVPQHQQVSALSHHLWSSQLHGLMPSFFSKSSTNPLNSLYGFPILKSPRQAYSEPILRSEAESDRNSFSHQHHQSETSRFSANLIKNKNFSKANEEIKGDTNHRTLIQDSNAENSIEHLSEMVISNSRGAKHDGGGDSNENQVVSKQVKLSNHNCLSPRARISRLQPSVITLELTESLLMDCLSNLKSPHWEDSFEAFSQIYNLTEIHPCRVKCILNKVIWYGLPHLSSPRTKLARMACICFKRLYQTQKRSMETEGERVFYRLLDLCGGLANNFIQQESRDALVAAVENMDPLKSLSFLELHGAKHKNPHVREFSAYLVSAIMDELPQTKLMNKEFSPRVIPMIVSFLREGLLQTRLHAKLALDKIYDHPNFDSKLKRYASPESVRHIAEILREFRVWLSML